MDDLKMAQVKKILMDIEEAASRIVIEGTPFTASEVILDLAWIAHEMEITRYYDDVLNSVIAKEVPNNIIEFKK